MKIIKMIKTNKARVTLEATPEHETAYLVCVYDADDILFFARSFNGDYRALQLYYSLVAGAFF